jgi:hypothetical protein
LVAGCTGDTDPATNVTHNSATLEANVDCEGGESGQWWFRYRTVSGPGAWQESARTNFTNCGTVNDHPVEKPVTGLSPDTEYEYYLAGRLKDGNGQYIDPTGYCAQDEEACTYDLSNPDTPWHSFTTDEAPTADAWPLIPAGSVDFEGDFEPSGGLSEWTTVYEDGATWTTPNTGAGEGTYYGRATSNSGAGGTRGELATPTLSAGAEWQSELLIYIPSATDYTGFISQHKQDETDGSCAQGGWAYPNEERDLLLRVRDDCDNDYTDLNFGDPARNQWVALWTHGKSANSGGFYHARVDPDGPGPQGYGAVQSVTGDTSAGGNVKIRVGSYGSMPNTDWLGVDDYRRNNLP